MHDLARPSILKHDGTRQLASQTCESRPRPSASLHWVTVRPAMTTEMSATRNRGIRFCFSLSSRHAELRPPTCLFVLELGWLLVAQMGCISTLLTLGLMEQDVIVQGALVLNDPSLDARLLRNEIPWSSTPKSEPQNSGSQAIVRRETIQKEYRVCSTHFPCAVLSGRNTISREKKSCPPKSWSASLTDQTAFATPHG